MRDGAKIVVLILLPINAWLCVFFYLNHQKAKYLELSHDELLRKDEIEVAKFLLEKHGVQVGQGLRLPISRPFIGPHPPLGKGYPVCFINISGLATPEIWEPAIVEALKASPYLHVVLLHPADGDLASIRAIWEKMRSSRLSAVSTGLGVERTLGNYKGGVLLILCDDKGIVQAIEPYPSLKISPDLEEEIADWRPKLHQAVKKVLDKFFPKR